LAYSNEGERLKFPGRFSLFLPGDLTIGELYCPMNLFINTSFHSIVIVRDKILSSFSILKQKKKSVFTKIIKRLTSIITLNTEAQ